MVILHQDMEGTVLDECSFGNWHTFKGKAELEQVGDTLPSTETLAVY